MRYRNYLQHDLRRKPNTVSRYLMSIKRYFDWATETEIISRDPTKSVKLVAQVSRLPRDLYEVEEESLITAVTNSQKRDWTLITAMLHTGLRI